MKRKVQAQRKFAAGAYIPPSASSSTAVERRTDTASAAASNSGKTIYNNMSAVSLIDLIAFQNLPKKNREPVVVLERMRDIRKVSVGARKRRMASPSDEDDRPLNFIAQRLRRKVRKRRLDSAASSRAGIAGVCRVTPGLVTERQSLRRATLRRSSRQKKLPASSLHRRSEERRLDPSPPATRKRVVKKDMTTRSPVMKRPDMSSRSLKRHTSQKDSPSRISRHTAAAAVDEGKRKGAMNASTGVRKSAKSFGERSRPLRQVQETQPNSSRQLPSQAKTRKQSKVEAWLKTVMPPDDGDRDRAKDNFKVPRVPMRRGQVRPNAKPRPRHNTSFPPPTDLSATDSVEESSCITEEARPDPANNYKRLIDASTMCPTPVDSGDADVSDSCIVPIRQMRRACVSRRYKTVRSIVHADERELSGRCRNCIHCRRIDKIKKLSHLVQQRESNDVYEFRADRDDAPDAPRLAFRPARAARAPPTPPPHSLDVSADAPPHNPTATEAPLSQYPKYVDLFPIEQNHVVEVNPIQTQGKQMMTARLIPRTAANVTNELSLIEHENLLDQLFSRWMNEMIARQGGFPGLQAGGTGVEAPAATAEADQSNPERASVSPDTMTSITTSTHPMTLSSVPTQNIPPFSQVRITNVMSPGSVNTVTSSTIPNPLEATAPEAPMPESSLSSSPDLWLHYDDDDDDDDEPLRQAVISLTRSLPQTPDPQPSTSTDAALGTEGLGPSVSGPTAQDARTLQPKVHLQPLAKFSAELSKPLAARKNTKRSSVYAPPQVHAKPRANALKKQARVTPIARKSLSIAKKANSLAKKVAKKVAKVNNLMAFTNNGRKSATYDVTHPAYEKLQCCFAVCVSSEAPSGSVDKSNHEQVLVAQDTSTNTVTSVTTNGSHASTYVSVQDTATSSNVATSQALVNTQPLLDSQATSKAVTNSSMPKNQEISASEGLPLACDVIVEIHKTEDFDYDDDEPLQTTMLKPTREQSPQPWLHKNKGDEQSSESQPSMTSDALARQARMDESQQSAEPSAGPSSQMTRRNSVHAPLQANAKPRKKNKKSCDTRPGTTSTPLPKKGNAPPPKKVKKVIDPLPPEQPKNFNTSGADDCFREPPVFYPTEEEFTDPLAYFGKISKLASKFGLCKVVAPESFQPECVISEDVQFNVANQYLSRLYCRWGAASREMCAIKSYLAEQRVFFNRPPLINGMELNLPKLHRVVKQHGGLQEVIAKKRWGRVAEDMQFARTPRSMQRVDRLYVKHILPYAALSTAERRALLEKVERSWLRNYARMTRRASNPLHRQKRLLEESASSEDGDSDSDSHLARALAEAEDCVVAGRQMKLSVFKKVAEQVMSTLFSQRQPSPSQVEEQYWDLVGSAAEHVCVYSASIDTGEEGLGFTKAYNHPWNLKMLSQNGGNVLRSLGPVLGVTVPTMHLGMVLSTSCWHRDPHGLPWVEYLHHGPAKIWYGVPDELSAEFRSAVEALCPTACQNKSIWLPSDITMIPPRLLAARGVPLTRLVQRPGEFIVVLPKAYSSSISTGYTQSESVYFATQSWLEDVAEVFQELKASCEPTMFSLEQLLLAVAVDPRSQPSVLAEVRPALAAVAEQELAHRRELAALGVILHTPESLIGERQRKPAGAWNVREQDECEICRTTLYLSKVTGLTSQRSSFCLEHALRVLNRRLAAVPDAAAKALATIFVSQADLEEALTNVDQRLAEQT